MTEIDPDFIETKFIEYCRYNTRSDASSQEVPSTPGQVKLAKQVVQDLAKLGLKSWYNAANGYALGFLAGNSSADVSAIGFFAHLDTADYPAEGVAPQVHPDYDGQDVVLNAAKEIVLRTAEFPELRKLQGQRLITTDGTTLLGADDKAGVAGLFGALKALVDQPELKHGPIYVAFGPDEEIGQGAKRFDAGEFPVEFAYTLDNGQPGDIEYETFNAAQAVVEFTGTAVHPGDAYGLMVNAASLANEFAAALPRDEVPEKSQGKEGFIMLVKQSGTVDQAELQFIIRDFDEQLFAQKKQFLTDLTAKFNARFDQPRVKLTLKEQYANIGTAIKQNPYIVNLALDTYRKLGLTPNITPFRGGTDGNFLTAKGIPAPNLFNAGSNFHGKYEYVTVEGMQVVAETVVTLCQEHVLQTGQRNEQPLA
ncbi:peptidase T [Ligilactobacillus salitolerans]|uniref:Peptidase T n=1 Tax=Ligilactobacillus salitolerans TaxID=1808352 RepID=A0A401ITE5_9LACO|nr:peptidase T [Ligilactobacillus salitolerans]GBG94820.1 peptidase T [Ligilactobacillus salitolerans]